MSRFDEQFAREGSYIEEMISYLKWAIKTKANTLGQVMAYEHELDSYRLKRKKIGQEYARRVQITFFKNKNGGQNDY